MRFIQSFKRELVRLANRYKAQHTRTRSRGPRHTDFCFVIVNKIVESAPRDSRETRSSRGIVNVRVLKRIVLHIKNAKNDTVRYFLRWS